MATIYKRLGREIRETISIDHEIHLQSFAKPFLHYGANGK